MKHYYVVIALAIWLVACNSGTERGNIEADSSLQSEDRTEAPADRPDTAMSGTAGNQMKAMHDAMTQMMDRIKTMTASGNVDRDFAMMMKHHHQGGADMAKAEVAGGTDDSMKVIAQRIMDEQLKDIEELDMFLQANQGTGTSDFAKKTMGMMTEMTEMKMDGSSLDAMFATMMIPHHRDAIKMSREYLKVGKNDSMRKLAQKIISSHPKEIRLLERWVDGKKA
jgi:uncharacterized protein (DUF305 family)